MLETQNRNGALFPDDTQFRKAENSVDVVKTLAHELSLIVVGQEEATEIIAREITLWRAGMSDPTKPRSTLLFTGLTGVGKTEMTEAIAKVIYGDKWQNHYLKVDCNELQNKGSVTKLTGSSPTWVGYGDPTLVTREFLNQEGGSVIVFDEVEKAHPDIWNVFLSITDKATMTIYAATGKSQKANRSNDETAPTQLNFSNSIVIFTSNAGAEEMQKSRGKSIGFISTNSQNIKQVGLQSVKSKFEAIPEFLGRIGEKRIVVFNELKEIHYEQIFDNLITDINRRIPGMIYVGSALKNWVIKQAIGSGNYGARDLKHAINEQIVSFIAELRTAGVIKNTTEVYVDRKDEDFVFYEGLEVVTEDEDERSEVTIDKELNTSVEIPQTKLEFEYNLPFTIPSIEVGQVVSNVVHKLILYNAGVEKGVIEIKEVSIEKNADQPLFISNGKLYRFSVQLAKVLKSNPNTLVLQVNNIEYSGVNRFSRIRKGLVRLYVDSWKTKQDEKKSLDLVFNINDLQQASFIIKQD